MNFIKKSKGITLIALVITIIVLMILAGISLNFITGDNGIIKQTKDAVNETKKQSAIEKIEFKIDSIIIEFYKEKYRKISIQELAEVLSIDKEVEYVKDKNIESTKPEDFSSVNAIIIKLYEYSEQFEIDNDLKIKNVTYVSNNTDNSNKKINEALIGNISEIKTSGEREIVVKGKIGDIDESITYKVNAIVYNGDVVLDGQKNIEGAILTDTTYEFGDKTKDVATQTEEARNMVILKVNGNLTINEGITLTSCKSDSGYGGPKGFLIYCTGIITNNGTISMSERGAKAQGENVYLWENTDGTYEYVPAVGANGGNPVTVTNSSYSQKIENYYLKYGSKGDYGINRQTGGGGSGAARTNSGKPTSGKGGNGTAYSGGSGGGGIATYSQTVSGNQGDNNGGSGGTGKSYRNSNTGEYAAGGGAGNKGGVGYASGKANTALYGKNGTGGLLIIFSNDIFNNGTISSNGSTANGWVAVGGTSGGGSINMFYKNNFKNDGDIEADGGKKSNVGSGEGGRGSISVGTISEGQYVSTFTNY